MPKCAVLAVGLHHCYQFAPCGQSSNLERQQRDKFTEKVRDIIESFHPTIIADESPDTDNQELLSLFPRLASRLCIDIPFGVKCERHIHIQRVRTEYGEELCPFVDELRERYWKWQLFRRVSSDADARVLILCGSMHLQPSASQRKSFIEKLRDSGYIVNGIDLRQEAWWDESWVPDYWKRYLWSLPNAKLDGSPPENCCLISANFDPRRDVCRRRHLYPNRSHPPKF